MKTKKPASRSYAKAAAARLRDRLPQSAAQHWIDFRGQWLVRHARRPPAHRGRLCPGMFLMTGAPLQRDTRPPSTSDGGRRAARPAQIATI